MFFLIHLSNANFSFMIEMAEKPNECSLFLPNEPNEPFKQNELIEPNEPNEPFEQNEIIEPNELGKCI